MDPITIREVREADHPALIAMIGRLSEHHDKPATITPEILARDLEGPAPWFYGLIAERDGVPAGYALLIRVYFAQFGDRGMDLHHLYVEPELRGAGLGKRLVRAAIDKALEMGCVYFRVNANLDNPGAQRFYRSLGMRRSDPQGIRYVLDLDGPGANGSKQS